MPKKKVPRQALQVLTEKVLPLVVPDDLDEANFEIDLEDDWAETGENLAADDVRDPSEGTSACTQEMVDLRKTVEELKQSLAKEEHTGNAEFAPELERV